MHRSPVSRLVAIAFVLIPAMASGRSQAAPSPAISSEPPGTIIVRTNQRRLCLVVAPGQTISYPVGVGRASKQWSARPTSPANI